MSVPIVTGLYARRVVIVSACRQTTNNCTRPRSPHNQRFHVSKNIIIILHGTMRLSTHNNRCHTHCLMIVINFTPIPLALATRKKHPTMPLARSPTRWFLSYPFFETDTRLPGSVLRNKLQFPPPPKPRVRPRGPPSQHATIRDGEGQLHNAAHHVRFLAPS